LLVGLFLLLVELLTPGGFYIFFFGIGAIVIGLLAAAKVAGPLWVQWFLFSVVSVGSLLLLRKPLLKNIQTTGHAGTVSNLAGETAHVLEKMPVGENGRVEMRGTSWSARNIGTTVLTCGQRCMVERVEGIVLCVRGA